MPKKIGTTKSKRSSKKPPRTPIKKKPTILRKIQRHTRVNRISIDLQTPIGPIVSKLMGKSVRDSSNKTYSAAVNSICAALNVTDPKEITKDTFLRFLDATSNEGNVSAQGYRSALLLHQRRHRCDPWAGGKDVILAAKGAVRLGNEQKMSVPKGCMTESMLATLVSTNPEKICSVKICKHCTSWFTGAKANQSLVKATQRWTELQFTGRLRPGEIECLCTTSLVHTSELVGARHNQVRVELAQFVFKPDTKKNQQGKETFPVPKESVIPFQACVAIAQSANNRQKNVKTFLAPRCCDTHIGQLVSEAAQLLSWSDEVCWVAHAVKTSALTALTSRIDEAVTQFASGVVLSTFNGYTSRK